MSKLVSKKLISGITSSGSLTLAHYLIVFNQLPKISSTYEELLLFIGDLHGITQAHDPKTTKALKKELEDYFFACVESAFENYAIKTGEKIDIKSKVKIFVQSKIKEIPLLSFFLSCHLPIGGLKRMTQFKTKKNENPNTALFTYPILMAADILLFDADVIVGNDQVQHIELTTNVAKKINEKFDINLFHPPIAVPFKKQEFRIMDLQNPENKMSKSSKQVNGIIFLHDSEKLILKKFKSAKTDSLKTIKFDFAKQPGVSNLILIYSFCEGISIAEAEKKLQKKCQTNYLTLKETVGESAAKIVGKIQKKVNTDQHLNREWMKNSLTTVSALANQKMTAILAAFGF